MFKAGDVCILLKSCQTGRPRPFAFQLTAGMRCREVPAEHSEHLHLVNFSADAPCLTTQADVPPTVCTPSVSLFQLGTVSPFKYKCFLVSLLT